MQFRFGLIAKYGEILAQTVLIKTKIVLTRTNTFENPASSPAFSVLRVNFILFIYQCIASF